MFDTRYVLSGWSSTISMFLFIGGMIMLMLGIIGEYIGRIYISINNSPQYVIKEIVNQGLRPKRG
jgi:undecaprenyl-phosphate 4-deoxy-4-formamido-L-arabinose transferase